MTDLHYRHPKLVSVYDLGNGWSEDRDFYLSLAGDTPQRIMDLGCGTGLLCNAYAERGHSVTGVDPSAPMLDAARRTRFGKVIEWVESGAQSFRSDETFDLIVMTGHAFQVLLGDNDIRDVFSGARRHLAADGLFAFETRNPRVDWAHEWDGMHRELHSLSGLVRESFKVRSVSNERIVFETEYAFEDERLLSVSELRFPSFETIEGHLHNSSLRIHRLLGDWDGSPFTQELSREMIFLVKSA